MNLFEKLNRLDDSLTESKRVVKKKKLTEGHRVEPKISEFNVGDRVAERYNDSEFNVGTIAEIKKDAEGIQYLVKWDYSDREDEEWLYGDVLSLWVEDETEDVYDDNIDEMLTENRNNPYFTPYGYRDAAKVLNGKAPEYYYHLKEIEMDTGDGIKLARYALRKGLPVMVDKNSDPDYPEFAIKGEYHWDDYFYPYPTAHEEDLVAWDGKMFTEQSLTEDSNSVSSQLPEDVDIFLQDLAQMYGMFDYKDIMNHKYTAEEIKKLRNYERRFNAEVEYEGDEEADAIMKDIAEKVAIVVKNSRLTEEQEDLVAGKVYTLKEDTFICDNDPATIKNYLSNPDENSVKHVQQTYLKNEDIVIPRGTKLRYIKQVLIKSFYYDMYGDGKVVFLFSTEFKKHLN